MTVGGQRERLDVALVRRGLAVSRSQARDFITRGVVCVRGETALKPGVLVSPVDEIAVAPGEGAWVSRGALKLLAALDAFHFDPSQRVAVDVGASTGGFTQVLLSRGATRVYAVDVGHGQLHASVAAEPRVVNLENTDTRALTDAQIPDRAEAIVADVSFISLTKALPAVLELAADGCWLVALVKPQFEAGREAIGKGGIVREAADRERALAHVKDWMARQPHWRVAGVIPSPIAGGSGNQEFLLGAVRDG
jgi:23S rRNA (cytidine1920-2'-O)/16S rRNA (cytidine1409-2'-O)-methyltransferase